MALQLRRGTDAERLQFTPLAGELVYTTDTKEVYIGDGSTVGGLAVTAFTQSDAELVVTSMFASLEKVDNLTLEKLDNVLLTSPAVAGQTLTFDGLRWTNEDFVGIQSVSDDASPQLGANLDLNQHSITGTGNIVLNNGFLQTNTIKPYDATLTVISNTKPAIRINTSSDGTLSGIPFLEINLSRGSASVPTDTLASDYLSGLKFTGYSDGAYKYAGSVSSQWKSTATMSNSFPGSKLIFSAGNNAGGVSQSSFDGVSGALTAPVLQTGVYVTTPSDNRPANPSKGMIIFNDTTSEFQGWNGSSWVTLG